MQEVYTVNQKSLSEPDQRKKRVLNTLKRMGMFNIVTLGGLLTSFTVIHILMLVSLGLGKTIPSLLSLLSASVVLGVASVVVCSKIYQFIILKRMIKNEQDSEKKEDLSKLMRELKKQLIAKTSLFVFSVLGLIALWINPVVFIGLAVTTFIAYQIYAYVYPSKPITAEHIITRSYEAAALKSERIENHEPECSQQPTEQVIPKDDPASSPYPTHPP